MSDDENDKRKSHSGSSSSSDASDSEKSKYSTSSSTSSSSSTDSDSSNKSSTSSSTSSSSEDSKKKKKKKRKLDSSDSDSTDTTGTEEDTKEVSETFSSNTDSDSSESDTSSLQEEINTFIEATKQAINSHIDSAIKAKMESETFLEYALRVSEHTNWLSNTSKETVIFLEKTNSRTLKGKLNKIINAIDKNCHYEDALSQISSSSSGINKSISTSSSSTSGYSSSKGSRSLSSSSRSSGGNEASSRSSDDSDSYSSSSTKEEVVIPEKLLKIIEIQKFIAPYLSDNGDVNQKKVLSDQEFELNKKKSTEYFLEIVNINSDQEKRQSFFNQVEKYIKKQYPNDKKTASSELTTAVQWSDPKLAIAQGQKMMRQVNEIMTQYHNDKRSLESSSSSEESESSRATDDYKQIMALTEAILSLNKALKKRDKHIEEINAELEEKIAELQKLKESMLANEGLRSSEIGLKGAKTQLADKRIELAQKKNKELTNTIEEQKVIHETKVKKLNEQLEIQNKEREEFQQKIKSQDTKQEKEKKEHKEEIEKLNDKINQTDSELHKLLEERVFNRLKNELKNDFNEITYPEFEQIQTGEEKDTWNINPWGVYFARKHGTSSLRQSQIELFNTVRKEIFATSNDFDTLHARLTILTTIMSHMLAAEAATKGFQYKSRLATVINNKKHILKLNSINVENEEPKAENERLINKKIMYFISKVSDQTKKNELNMLFKRSIETIDELPKKNKKQEI